MKVTIIISILCFNVFPAVYYWLEDPTRTTQGYDIVINENNNAFIVLLAGYGFTTMPVEAVSTNAYRYIGDYPSDLIAEGDTSFIDSSIVIGDINDTKRVELFTLGFLVTLSFAASGFGIGTVSKIIRNIR